MKKLFQSATLQTSFRDTVSGISDSAARYVKQNTIFSTPKDKEQQQFLRLPLESARRLRWYDREELNQLVQVHTRERQELEDVNDALRGLLLDSGMWKDKIDAEISHRMALVDKERAIEEGVNAVLVVSLQTELERLKQASQEQQLTPQLQNRMSDHLSGDENSQLVELVVETGDENGAESHVTVQLLVSDVEPSRSLQIDAGEFRRQCEEFLNSLQEYSTSGEGSVDAVNGQVLERADEISQQLSGVLRELDSVQTLEQQLKDSEKEKQKLQEALTSQRQKDRRKQHPAEVLARAQDMCAVADDRARQALRRAELAEVRASKAEKAERDTRGELQVALTNIRDMEAQNKSAGDQEKAHMETQLEKLRSVEAECRQLESVIERITCEKSEAELHIQQLEDKVDVYSMEVAAARGGLAERDELQMKLENLQDTMSDFRSAAERSDHYRQVVRELEQSAAQSQEELLSTARVVTGLEKKLKDALAEASKQQAKADKMVAKYEKLRKSVKNGSYREEEEYSNGVGSWPEAAQIEIGRLEGELRALADRIDSANAAAALHEQEKSTLTQEKDQLEVQVSNLRDQVVYLDRQNLSSVCDLKRSLSQRTKEMEECKQIVEELERERYELLRQLHSHKTRPTQGIGQSLGSGSFHDTSSGGWDRPRDQISGIDTLYLKNVLFKFIEATAQGKTRERDALVPAVATLLEASPQEFKALKNALSDASSGSSYFSLPFWQRKK